MQKSNASDNLGPVALFRRLKRSLKGYLWKISLLGMLSLLSACAEAATLALLVPLALTSTVGTSPFLETTLGGLLQSPLKITTGQLALLTFTAVVFRAVFQIIVSLMDSRISTSFEVNTRRALTLGYLQSSWSCQSTERIGNLQGLLTENVNWGMKAIHAISGILVAGCNFFILIGFAFVLAPMTALVIVIMTLVLAGISRPITRLARNYSIHRAGLNQRLNTELNQAILMSREIRIFNVDLFAADRLSQLFGKIRKTRFASLMLASLVPVVFQWVVLTLLVVGLAIAAYSNVDNLQGIGTAALLLVRALNYSQAFQSLHHQIVEAIPFLDQLETQTLHYASNQMSSSGERMSEIKSISFKNVGFHYISDQVVFKDISFDVRQGELIGIIGPSGSGKTSLMQLLLRLREPTSGQVLINGRSAAEFSLRSWYERVALVPQEPLMFDDTIENCIRFYRKDVSAEDAVYASELAGIHRDIALWKDGYATNAGERGGGLSGGQRQRICIARALAGNPELIVFDEPTSALDPRAEAVVVDTLKKLKGTATIFVIAHRTSTVAICDRIMVLNQGVIEAFDAPSELSHRNEYFIQSSSAPDVNTKPVENLIEASECDDNGTNERLVSTSPSKYECRRSV